LETFSTRNDLDRCANLMTIGQLIKERKRTKSAQLGDRLIGMDTAMGSFLNVLLASFFFFFFFFFFFLKKKFIVFFGTKRRHCETKLKN
jgi:hypothetical protein